MNHSTPDLFMHTEILFWAGGIIAYGVYQYIKRENLHRAHLMDILAGSGIASVPSVPKIESGLWKFISSAAVEILLVAAIIWLVTVTPRIFYGRTVAYVIALLFVILSGFLMPMFLRSFKEYRSRRKR